MAHLILVRHARSEWNAKGIWTGWNDVGLSEHAEDEVAALARQLPSLEIGVAYTSLLRRAQETLQMLLTKLDMLHLPTIAHAALNERHYGIYAGKNKWEIREQLGEEAFMQLRRGWDYPVPEGETLKDVYERIVPYYEETILADLKEGKNVLVVAHGNSLRALMKYLEGLSEEGVSHVQIGVAEAYIYEIDAEGSVIAKNVHVAEGSQAV